MVTNMIAFCETNSVPYPDEQPRIFRMFFDGYENKNDLVYFKYMANPEVHAVSPLASYIRLVGLLSKIHFCISIIIFNYR